MRSIPKQLATFAVVLATLFGVGLAAGQVIGADAPGGKAKGHGSANEMKGMTGHGGGADPVRGLAVAENGLRLVVDDPELRRGQAERLRYRIVDERGATVRDFEVEATKRMHLVVARRDLTGFQHLHPEQAADGSWTVALRLDEPGSYRLFADFATGGKPHTLASDLRVDGSADLVDLPAPEPRARTSDGYDVRLDGSGEDLRFTVMRGGRVVHVEPYLGAGGHLVALREGDLAFLHVHPVTGEGHDDSIRFGATFPTAGRYRLFLQFKHEGRVHTAAFTKAVR